ncbi:hypothetical protein AVEN_43659-1 [Araneus ventricosus]|uniref:Uncharacterized protein n=1 Tax=Araneus ventricosus TaxID=182803 RepID=A0A4Y2SFA1_ARAVE|nr:hypothetical protein AVEN_43659-1 [Araneus ventricosus]
MIDMNNWEKSNERRNVLGVEIKEDTDRPIKGINPKDEERRTNEPLELLGTFSFAYAGVAPRTPMSVPKLSGCTHLPRLISVIDREWITNCLRLLLWFP